MSHQQGKVGFLEPECHKHDGERERCDDLCIDDGNSGNRTDRGFYPPFAVIHAERAQRSEHCGECGGGKGKAQGVADHRHDLGIREQIPVMVKRESARGADHVGIDKAVDGKQQNGGIEQQKDKTDKYGFQAFIYKCFSVHRFAPLTVSSSRNPPVSHVERNTTMSRIRATIEPMCQFVPKYS